MNNNNYFILCFAIVMVLYPFSLKTMENSSIGNIDRLMLSLYISQRGKALVEKEVNTKIFAVLYQISPQDPFCNEIYFPFQITFTAQDLKYDKGKYSQELYKLLTPSVPFRSENELNKKYMTIGFDIHPIDHCTGLIIKKDETTRALKSFFFNKSVLLEFVNNYTQ